MARYYGNDLFVPGTGIDYYVADTWEPPAKPRYRMSRDLRVPIAKVIAETGEVVEIYPSAAEAAKDEGITVGGLRCRISAGRAVNGVAWERVKDGQEEL